MERFVLEIGTEEIPAGYIQPALEALASNLSKRLSAARISHGSITVYGTPRRLALAVDDMIPRQPSLTETVTGPPAKIGLDENGNPTVAAVKFAAKVGLEPSRLKVVQTDKGRYLAAKVTEKGKATPLILKQILPELILSTPFPKTMRWGQGQISFARPIHWILALYGKKAVVFNLDQRIKSGRFTRGHMFMSPGRIKVDSADQYPGCLQSAHVVADPAARKEMVRKQIVAAAARAGGQILEDQELVDIVTNLVETPVATVGRFDDQFLELPREILITAMREHQKYFAVVHNTGRLMPCFVAVNNTNTRDPELVARGHERVLRARLSDARFFFKVDSAVKMDTWVEQLKGVLFQADLGTMYAKIQRVENLAGKLAEMTVPDLKGYVRRAARLCKADLVSQVVNEFPKLQGVMGRIYAEAAGEPDQVAAAIEEHYRPVSSGGSLPETMTGALLAIADKLDTICGCFNIGLLPTGASDPYALRRQGIGIVQIMLDKKLELPLGTAVKESLRNYNMQSEDELNRVSGTVVDFISNRVSRMLVDEGYSKDIVSAVVAVGIDNIPYVWRRVEALNQLKGQPDFEPLAVAFKRVANILRKSDENVEEEADPGVMTEPAEIDLMKALDKVCLDVDRLLAIGDLEKALTSIASLRAPVDRFFDDVMVMVDDDRLRRNRLALLAQIASLFMRIADFAKIST